MSEGDSPRVAPGTTAAEPAAAGYRQVRRNMTDLLTDSTDLTVVVPSCPDWTVGDLASHLVQVCARVHDRVVSGSATTEGPDAGPAAVQFSLLPADRATAPLPAGGIGALLDDWARLSGPVEQLLGEPFSVRRGILVMDAYTHELDLRRALRLAPPSPDHPARPVAMGILVKGLSASTRGHGLPAIQVETDLGRFLVGEGDPAATVAGSWYDVYLAMSGRLTEERIRTLRWSADPTPWIRAFTWGPFVVPAQ